MEPENQASFNPEKLTETVDKYVDLIKENKVYEFAQKIQLLSHRKQQSKKFQQAEHLLVCGVERLFTFQTTLTNDVFSLLDHLLKLYETHPDIWNLEKGRKIFQILNIKEIQRKYEYYVRFSKTLKNKPFPKDLILDLIKYYLSRNEFTKAESHILELDLAFVKNFIQKWGEKVSAQEFTAIQCRIALLRGLFTSFEESEHLLLDVNRQSPFYKFANFLISASKLKSKDSYNLIGSRYKQFLEADTIYNKIYDGYGTYFFKVNTNKGNSLLSMFG